jgi:hypothetical protein
MFLGITVLGWIIIAVVYLPLLAVLAMRRGRGAGRRGTVILFGVSLLLLGAAVGEALYVDWRFRTLCRDAGVQISARPVVEGLFADNYYASLAPEDLNLNRGPSEYHFIEWRDTKGRYWRTEKTDGPKSRTIPIEAPQARYHWHMPLTAQAVGHSIRIREETVVDTVEGKVIGRQLNVYRYPAMVDQLWWGFFDPRPEICGELRDIRSEVLVGVDRQRREK